MITKWEYMSKRVYGYICTHPPKEDREKGETGEGNIKQYFDNLGYLGWELCGIDDGLYYFKRPLNME